ncbi:hypothetical protein [Nonomuraea typhae]|uniref:hypothetical protein n=1 Tax=Nonomuraea typhae TaxID=2603600 RepID=UPI0012F7815D|nr:hypothetical protein [Nonomuraea typhae]
MQTHEHPNSDADLLDYLHQTRPWRTRTHFHGYTWTGPSALPRHPETPRHPGDDGFTTCPAPPAVIGDWLLKEPGLIADNCPTATQAATWMTEVWLKHQALALCPDWVDVNRRVHIATGTLRARLDARWEDYLHDGRFLHIAAVACPQRILPHPCPLERAEDAGPGAVPGGHRPALRVGGAVTIPWYPPPWTVG